MLSGWGTEGVQGGVAWRLDFTRESQRRWAGEEVGGWRELELGE